jgi:archaellum component FlaC
MGGIMPREIDFEAFEHQLGEMLSREQLEWLAMLLHDHVSGLVGNIAIQTEVVNKMLERDMDIRDEFASLKENVGAASRHIVEIEKRIRRAMDAQ